MTPPTSLPLTTAIRRLAEPVLDRVGPSGPLAVLAEEVAAGLEAPVRLAVAGRVKAGKSTLVNALLRQKVAPTAEGECTRHVTWYRFGVPERCVVVCRDGERIERSLEADGSLPTELGVEAERISHLDVSLSIDALRDLWLIDTPGLASATAGASDPTAELLALDAASRTAITRADGLLLVMAVEPRADDAQAVAAFERNFAGVRRSTISTVAVLNKVDQLGLRPGDVRSAARTLAEGCADRLPTATVTVLPLVALLAETVDTGALTEADASALHALAELDEGQRELLLLSPDRFLTTEVPVPATTRRRLLDLLDLTGVRGAIEVITHGGRGAVELADVLRERSGIGALQEVLEAQVRQHADAMKATWAIAALERLAYAPAAADDRDVQVALREVLERIELDPQLVQLGLLRALQSSGSGEVALPRDLDHDLRRLATEPEPAAKLGLTAPGADIGEAVVRTVGRWRRFVNGPRTSAVERQLGDTVLRSLDGLAGADATAEAER